MATIRKEVACQETRGATPQWLLQGIWFIAGVFATGAVWYFLARNEYRSASWAIFSAVVSASSAIGLQIRNDLIYRKKHKGSKAWDLADERRSHPEAVAPAPSPVALVPADQAAGSFREAGPPDPSPPLRVTLADGTAVDVEFSVQCQVKPENAPRLIVQLGSFENAISVLRPIVEAAVLSRVTGMTFTEISRSLAKISADVARTVADRAQPMGISVHGVDITKLTLLPARK